MLNNYRNYLSPHNNKDCVGCQVCALYTNCTSHNRYTVHTYSKKYKHVHFRDKNIKIVICSGFQGSSDYLVLGNLECSHMVIYDRLIINLLPRQLTFLKLHSVINKFIFPKMLKTLGVESARLYSARVLLPKNMVVASLGVHECVFLLSKYILILSMDKCTDTNSVALPKKINNVTLDKEFNTPINLSKNSTNVYTFNSFDKLIALPKGIKRLNIGYRLGKIIDLNIVLLPKSLKDLSIICGCTTKIIFTESIVCLNTYSPNEYLVDNVPNSVVRWKWDSVRYGGKYVYGGHFANVPNSIIKEYLE